jgi:6-phospho-beta-glucosidase
LIHAEPQNIANAAFHQFLASALTVKEAHENFPELKIGMMLAYGPVYGYTSDPADQLLAMQEEDRPCSTVMYRCLAGIQTIN